MLIVPKMLRRWKPSSKPQTPPVKCTLCWAALIWYTFADNWHPALTIFFNLQSFFLFRQVPFSNSVRVGCSSGIVIVLCNGQTCYIACGGQFISNGFVIFWDVGKPDKELQKVEAKIFLARFQDLTLVFIRFALPYAFISNGLPTCQSVVTSVPNRYCFMRCGIVRASILLMRERWS